MKLLLLGATGLVGNKALELALANAAISEVIAPTRTPLPARDRLLNPVAERLEELFRVSIARQPDAVLCALGTTQAKAGSKEAFRYVDHELPIAFGRAAFDAGIKTYALVSAMGASATSVNFYTRTKGEVERDIQKIGFQSLTICRPSLIGGERKETRRAERAALALVRLLAPVLPKKFHLNPAEAIAAAALDAVIAAKPGNHFIYAEQMR
ncbi:NAD-dependent dehydratase [Rhizobium sp. Rhizsp82]|uniref:NAD-dependent dehydratase n=1 Tax=Rhizobium sp. Rhizsp82 TaxID=3243057 RepID=UPI0039B5098B